jgi:MFS family permease
VKAKTLRGVRTTFRALRNRNFRLFFAGQLISQAGTWLTTIALTLLVLQLTHSGVAIGLLTAAQFGPVLLFGAWGGLIADRSDKRRLLIITQTLEMLQSFTLAALAFMSHPPVAAFYLALAGGIMLAFDNPARRSFVAEMVPASDVQNAVTLNSALMTSSRVIGPALAGVLVVTAGFGWCFLIDGISYLAVIASLFMMRRSELRQPPVVARARGQLRAAVRYIRAVPDLWIPLTMMTIVGTLTFNFAVVIPLFVEHTLHGSNGSFTLLYSVLSIGSVVGALAAAHLKVIDTRHVVWASIGFGAAMFVLAGAPTLPSAFPIALFVGLTSVAFITTSTAIVQVKADPAMRGRVLALQGMVLIGSTPIGGPLLGWICDVYGARAGILLGAAAAVAAGVWGYVMHRRIVESRAVEATREMESAGLTSV